jgi:4-diphosphocytidyl-2-C-methyl-D-erythritol kinase
MTQPLKAIHEVLAPAKLNLFLHITGRRPDGYHLLQSVFMLIDWCDTLHFELRHDGLITREDLGGEPGTEALPADDLCVRAARALQAATGTRLGVHIGLEKRIPAQAGMGGGSSDAASCLLALQRLWGVRLAPDALAALALKLGADVPFFLSGGHAWAEGIGDQLTPISLPASTFMVVKPPVGVSTPSIFASPHLKRNTKTATLAGFAAEHGEQTFRFGQNDLQPVAQQLSPLITQSLDWLEAQGLQGRMTGSGSAVFAQIPHELPHRLPAHTSQPKPPDEWIVKKCSNLEIHPLAGW